MPLSSQPYPWGQIRKKLLKTAMYYVVAYFTIRKSGNWWFPWQRKPKRLTVPVVVLDPHEDVIHPLSAHWWRMGDKSRHRTQELLKLNWCQEGNNLVDDIQTNSLPCFIPGGTEDTYRNMFGVQIKIQMSCYSHLTKVDCHKGTGHRLFKIKGVKVGCKSSKYLELFLFRLGLICSGTYSTTH